MVRRSFMLAVLAAAAFAAPPLAGGARAEEGDAARARAAVQRGEIQPLAGILANIQDRYEGRVIETELESHHGHWIYEFKLLPPTGRMFTVRVDAATGRMLETHGPAQERP